MEEQGAVAQAVAAKRQAARIRVPRREGERAEASRHSGIPPALVHATDQYPVRDLRKLRRCKPKRAAEFLTIVETGQRRE